MCINIFIILSKLVFRRRPAWTDRILYKTIDPSNEKFILEVLSYKFIESIQLSDHRPVYSETSVQVIKLKHLYQMVFSYLIIFYRYVVKDISTRLTNL